MDFMNAVMHHKVHFCTHTFLFWTSSMPHSTSTSNPPRVDLPFGLSPVFPPPQRPIHHFLTSYFGLHPCLTPLQRPICHASVSRYTVHHLPSSLSIIFRIFYIRIFNERGYVNEENHQNIYCNYCICMPVHVITG